jgi:hypothetical protein
VITVYRHIPLIELEHVAEEPLPLLFREVLQLPLWILGPVRVIVLMRWLWRWHGRWFPHGEQLIKRDRGRRRIERRWRWRETRRRWGRKPGKMHLERPIF